MCPPVLALLAAGASSLAGALLTPKPAKPPPLPAMTPADARAPGATVHVGDGQDREVNDDPAAKTTQFEETRLFGRPVGGLGKGGLAI